MTNIKVVEVKGKNAGKTIVILAGLHGNEICGVKAFDKLIPNLKIESGKVFFIYANLRAIKENKRFIDYNLNRAFLKEQLDSIKETLECKTAREIMPYLDIADAVLDIHASFTKESIPFIICDKSQIEKAKMFDAEIISFNWDPFEAGSTDYYMNKQNKPGFCFECGYLGEPKTQQAAEKAIIEFLTYYKCLRGEIKLKEKQRVLKIISLYKNKESPFRKTMDFRDFEILKKKTLIGNEGKKEIYGREDQILLFIRDSDEINDECFLIAEEISDTKKNLRFWGAKTEKEKVINTLGDNIGEKEKCKSI